VHIDIIMKSHH